MDTDKTPKTAVVFGATGLTGSHLVNLLLNDSRYDSIRLFGRTDPDIQHPKAVFIKTDLFELDKVRDQLTGDDLFCCLGSTLKRAGSREIFHKIDHDAVVEIASIARYNGFHSFAVISSIGAGRKSSNYYIKAKHEMEEDVKALSFTRLVIVRPSFIGGKRKEIRLAEMISYPLIWLLSVVMIGPLKKYRAIPARIIAKAMIALSNSPDTKQVYESGELWKC